MNESRALKAGPQAEVSDADAGPLPTDQTLNALSWIVAVLGYLYYLSPLLARLVLARPVSLGLALGLLLPGALGLIALAWRKRYPLVVAWISAALWAVSPVVIGVVAVAQANLARREGGRTALVVGTGFVMLIARTVGMVPYGYEPGSSATIVEAALSVLAVVVGTLAGFVVASRTQAAASDQAAARARFEAEQSRLNEARLAERERIAREMHDVVAHRISLVALHAGALAYRTDLGPEETREVARLIQTNAQASLTELRAMLTDLRGPDLPPEAPQPTLDQLEVLIADAREAGQAITLDVSGALDDVPDQVSRQAFRIVQECLTNARKHAPGAPVSVTVDVRSDELLFDVRNAVADLAPRDETGAGLGLVGVRERAQLVGGDVRYGVERGAFRVEAVLPVRERGDNG